MVEVITYEQVRRVAAAVQAKFCLQDKPQVERKATARDLIAINLATQRLFKIACKRNSSTIPEEILKLF